MLISGSLAQSVADTTHFEREFVLQTSLWKRALCRFDLYFTPGFDQVDLKMKLTGSLLPPSKLMEFMNVFISSISWKKALQFGDCILTCYIKKCNVAKEITFKPSWKCPNAKVMNDYLERGINELISLLICSKHLFDCKIIQDDDLVLDWNEECSCPCGLSKEYHKISKDIFNTSFCMFGM